MSEILIVHTYPNLRHVLTLQTNLAGLEPISFELASHALLYCQQNSLPSLAVLEQIPKAYSEHHNRAVEQIRGLYQGASRVQDCYIIVNYSTSPQEIEIPEISKIAQILQQIK